MDDLKTIIRRLSALATCADTIARRLELQRTYSMVSKNATAVIGIAQVGTAARDFHTSVEHALTTLPTELKEMLQ